jgi:hypothetical protein
MGVHVLRSCLGLTLVLAVGAPALSAQTAGDERILFSTSSDGGDTTEFWASDAALLKTPEWRPADGDPPLSVASAVAIATAAARAQHPKFDDVEVRDVHIMAGSCGRGATRWFYSIDFSPVIDGQKMYGGNIGAVVLMNGDPVNPRIKKK